jgi:hypothetical protein
MTWTFEDFDNGDQQCSDEASKDRSGRSGRSVRANLSRPPNRKRPVTYFADESEMHSTSYLLSRIGYQLLDS